MGRATRVLGRARGYPWVFLVGESPTLPGTRCLHLVSGAEPTALVDINDEWD